MKHAQFVVDKEGAEDGQRRARESKSDITNPSDIQYLCLQTVPVCVKLIV